MCRGIPGPNSVRSALIDSCVIAAILAAIAVVMTAAVGHSAETIRDEADDAAAAEMDRAAREEAVERALRDDHIDSRQNTDDNLPSGHPNQTATDETVAMILGMRLEENEAGEVKVVDVGATTPAWDAGIRRGDTLVSLNGLEVESFPEWVKDITKVLGRTQDGQAVPVEVQRDDADLALRIRMPESRAAESRAARREQESFDQAELTQSQPPTRPGSQPPADQRYGHRTPYGGTGSLGPGWGVDQFFGDTPGTVASEDRLANRALAQLYRVDTLGNQSAIMNDRANTSQTNATAPPRAGRAAARPNAPGAPGTPNVTADRTVNQQPQQLADGQAASGGMVGVAAFQNNEQGVVALVEVRGLPQGSYLVGINQGSDITGFDNPFGNISVDPEQMPGHQQTAPDNRPVPQQDQQQQQQQPGQQSPRQPGAQQPLPGAPGNSPAGRVPGAGASGAGATDGASLAAPNGRPILAQQLDPNAAQPGAAAQPAPGANQQTQQAPQPGAAQGTAPNSNLRARDALNPDVRTPQRTPRTDAQRQRPDPDNPQGQLPFDGAAPIAGPGAPDFMAEIGVLQVGPTGEGQVQTQMEGMEVRHLAGLSVVVVPTHSQGGGLPPGTRNRPDPRNQPFNQNQPGTQQLPANQRQTPVAGGARPGTAGRQTAAAPNMPGQQAGTGPIATGIIRLAGDNDLPAQPSQRQGMSRDEQLREQDAATRDRIQQRQFEGANPTDDFNPSTR